MIDIWIRIYSWRSERFLAAHGTGQSRYEGQHEEDEEEEFRDAGGGARDTSEAEDARNKGDDEEGK